jgi:hypothetical protein
MFDKILIEFDQQKKTNKHNDKVNKGTNDANTNKEKKIRNNTMPKNN